MPRAKSKSRASKKAPRTPKSARSSTPKAAGVISVDFDKKKPLGFEVKLAKHRVEVIDIGSKGQVSKFNKRKTASSVEVGMIVDCIDDMPVRPANLGEFVSMLQQVKAQDTGSGKFTIRFCQRKLATKTPAKKKTKPAAKKTPTAKRSKSVARGSTGKKKKQQATPKSQTKKKRKPKKQPKRSPKKAASSSSGSAPASSANSSLASAVRRYKYLSPPKTISEKLFLARFWSYLANNCLPDSLAPNTITMLGFSCAVVAMVTTLVHSPALGGTIEHSWWAPLMLVLMFAYQTADGMDGPQARRLKCGSALGELVDHGADAIVVVVCAVIASENLSIGAGDPVFLLTVLAYHVGFFTSNMTLLHTRKQVFNMFDAQEAQLTIQASLALTWFTGSREWGTRSVDLNSISPQLAHAYKWALDTIGSEGGDDPRLNKILALLSILFSICGAARYVASSVTRDRSDDNASDVGRSTGDLAHQLFALGAWVVILALGWTSLSGSSAASGAYAAWAVVAAWGFGEVSNHLILVRIAETPFPSPMYIGAFLGAGAFYIANEVVSENLEQVRWTIAAAVVMFHFAHARRTASAVADVLGIEVFAVSR